jgi:tricarballylate dehydrogenase
VDLLHRRLRARGAVSYETGAVDLIVDESRTIRGVRAVGPEGVVDVEARGGVILACGGFQANVEMRVRYLGRFADSLIPRGSSFNTGEGLMMAIGAGARPAGQWGDYHSAVLDARSPKEECGVTALYNYQMGIFVDREGRRFIDEGEDFRDHTYVKFSKRIIEEADGQAWCLFDQKAFQREEFARAWRPVGPPLQADTWEELARQMGMPAEGLLDTIGDFNRAVQPGEYDLDRLDGKRTADHAAEEQLGADAGCTAVSGDPGDGRITFTFGGLKCDTRARVVDTRGN